MHLRAAMSRRAPTLLAGLLALVLAPPAAAQDGWGDEEDGEDGYGQDEGEATPAFVELRERGIHYYRNGKTPAAKLELQAALRAGADEDFQTHFFLARVHHELGELEPAFIEAEKAVEHAGDEEQAKQAKEFRDGLKSFYGEVVFHSAGPEAGPKRGYLVLEAQSPFIRPEKKRGYQQVRKRYLTTVVSLPRTVYLPPGQYKCNDVPFNVQAGEMAEVRLGLRSSPTEGEIPWLWVGVGTAAAAGAGVAAWFLWPRPEPERSVRFEGTVLQPQE